MPLFETIIFDLDGVIINSLEIMAKAFKIAYSEIVGKGKPPFDEYIKHLGKSFKQIMKAMNLPESMMTPYVNECNRLIVRYIKIS